MKWVGFGLESVGLRGEMGLDFAWNRVGFRGKMGWISLESGWIEGWNGVGLRGELEL